MSPASDLSVALDSLFVPTLSLDAHGGILNLNRAALDLLGDEAARWVGSPWQLLLLPEEGAPPRETAYPENGIWEVRSPAGHHPLRGVKVEVTVLPYPQDQAEAEAGADRGPRAHWLLFLRDVGATDGCSEPESARHARASQWADSIPGALSTYELFPDGTERVHYVSPGCYDLWELSAEEVEAHAEKLWDQVHEDDLEPMRASVRKSARGLTPWFHEWRITTPSGKQKWLQGSASPCLQPGGSILWHAYMLDVTDHRLAEEKHEEFLERSREQLRSLTSQLQNVRESERKELASELHDEVGQYLTVMALDLAELKRCKAEGNAQTQVIKRLTSTLKETLGAVQRLTESLRPPNFSYRGLASIIETHVETKLDDRGKVQFHVDVLQGEELARELPSSAALAMFRVFQESTTNVLRHSRAKKAWVRLGAEGSTLFLEVEDDGIGVTEEQIHHPLSLGLTGMRERIHALGGAFVVEEGDHGGTRTRAALDVEAPMAAVGGR